LRTGTGGATKERTIPRDIFCGLLPRHGRWLGTGCLWIVADSQNVGETLAIEAANQLDGDVHISIGSSRDDRRWQIFALDYSKRIAAPAKSNADIGLRGEAHLVGVNPDAEDDVSRPIARSADSEGRRVGPRARR
jgi:hypothetical protein